MGTNDDGSTKLGTLRFERLCELAVEQSVITAQESTLLQAERTSIEAAWKKKCIATFDKKVKVPLNPSMPVSDSNPEHPLEIRGVPFFLQRENPTATMTAAQAKKVAAEKAHVDKQAKVTELSARIEELKTLGEDTSAVVAELVALAMS